MREKIQPRFRRIVTILLTLLVALMLTGGSARDAQAANRGWVKQSKKVYYYTDAGKKTTGLKKIGSYYYYFNNKGVLQTGWKNMSGKYRYFQVQGALGTTGRMKINQFQNIGGKYFYFNKSGVVLAGLRKINNKYYYLNTSKKLGVRGAAARKQWVAVNGKLRYFGSNCAMVTNNWVGKYYVKGDGTIVTGWMKLNGYRYYMNKKGVRQTGFVTINKKLYYFDKNGRLVTDTTIGKYKMDANGVVTIVQAGSESSEQAETETPAKTNAKPRVLIVPGHGQGDVGAYSTWGYEYKYTRQFANLIYQRLKAGGKVDVDYYKNGSESYNLYEQHKSSLSSISKKITGKGTVKKQVLSLSKANANIPVLTNYDYVLEVHFNATAVSAKDPKGDGNMKGVSWYINQYNKTYAMENAIISKLVALGFKKFGTGVYKSEGLYNARICQELGVDYGLIESAFIDDGDDMKFYKAHYKDMAIAVADTMAAYLTK